MTYDMFKNDLIDMIHERMEDKNLEVVVRTITKNNGTGKEAVLIKGPDVKGSPVIYLQDMYRELQRGNDMEQIAKEIIDLFMQRNKVDLHEILDDWERARAVLSYKLINLNYS